MLMAVNERTLKMGSAPIFPLLVSMAVPGLLGTLTTYLYRTVDQIFVGNFVGRTALGGISVLAPFNNVIIALSLFITVGGTSLLALTMGRRDYEEANKLFTNIIIQAIGMALIVSVLFFIFAEPFVGVCGAKRGTETFRYAVIYLKIVTCGQVFNMLNQGLAAIIRTEGAAKYSMFANIVGAFFNIVLDALLIIVFKMGVAGAAIATIVSQLMGAAFSAAFFLTGKSSLRWAGFGVVDIKQMIYIAKMGIAPSIFQMLSLFTNILLNKSLQYYGDLDPVYSLIGGGELCISAVAIVNTVDNFIVSMTSGINQAVSPLISYNYGAKNYSRVKKASLCSQAMAGVFAIVIWSAMMLAPEFVCCLFGKGDEALISYGAMAMRACKMFALFGGFQMLVSMYFSSIGKPQVATFVSVSRHGLFLIPAMFIMPQFMGLKGVLYANSVSDGCSLIVVSFMYLHEMRRLSRLTDGEEIPAKRLINISKKSLTE
jgi:putative MATE family efflux protein